MKVIPCDSDSSGGASASSKAQEAALAEAALLQSLQHPHIVACGEVSFDPQQHAVRLLMEYMDGGDLQRLIVHKRDEVGKSFGAHFARSVLAAVGGALDYVHGRGVLHRDVKPANVLLSKRSKRIKLADFGIAKLIETTLGAKSVVGTPYYFSPEIVSGEAYGAPSDAWALGACLYEVVALRRPFEAANQLALVRRICEESPPDLPDEVAGDVHAAIQGLLEKNPKQRMQLGTALTISDAIAALVVDSSTAVSDTTAASDQGEIGTSDVVLASVSQTGESVPLSTPSSGMIQSDGGPMLVSAAAAARAALGAEDDDAEELHLALLALERECSDDRRASTPCSAGGTSDFAIEALTQELQVRVGALREDANEKVAALLADRPSVQHTSSPENPSEETLQPAEISGGGGSQASTPRGTDFECDARSEAEETIEVATTLGVDTGPAEEHLASARRMLSMRILWGEAMRFSLLPMRSHYEAVRREVATKFLLPEGMPLRLCWREGSDLFPLDSEEAWQECLQRRGLCDKPGRLEVCVQGDVPKKRRRVRRRTGPQPAGSAGTAPAVLDCQDVRLSVAGSQVFRAEGRPDDTAAVAPGDRARSFPRPTKRSSAQDYRATGRAWAMAPGREQPIHWAGMPLGSTPSQKEPTNSEGAAPDLGLCLDVRAATIRR